MNCCAGCGRHLNADVSSSNVDVNSTMDTPVEGYHLDDDLSQSGSCLVCGSSSPVISSRKRPRAQVPFDIEWAPIQQGLDQFMHHASIGISTPYSTLLALYTQVYNLSTRHDDREAVRDIRALLYAHMRSSINDYHRQQQILLLERERRMRKEREDGIRIFLMWATRNGIPDEVLGNLFHQPASPGFLELMTMHDVLAGFLPEAWSRHCALHRPFCLVFRYLEMYYVRDYALESVKGCLLRSFIEHLLAPFRHAVYVLLAYPGLLHPDHQLQETGSLLLNGGAGGTDCVADQVALAFMEMARSGREFPPELLAVLCTGYHCYHGAKGSGEGQTAESLEESEDGSSSAELEKVHRWHALPDAFVAEVERVVTAVMGADAVPRVLHKLGKRL
eukprot:GGOE01014131.1.p1 GENE.GGOE01014131.1~~GGOE01014131.1.p1  ORF type:complete len:390 (-),score=65.62 GGOE01014131.1:221-1390(-)